MLLLATWVAAQAVDYAPAVQPPSDEARLAIARFELPPGLAATLWAAEPLLANPVCFCFDAAGTAYVAETFRHHAGVTDMRDHMEWLDEDLAARTVAERLAMLQRHEGSEYDAKYAREHERVRRLRDLDGDGAADAAEVFSDGFNAHADGIGAGLLALGQDVYYACIPSLWRLRDADGDGRAEERQVLSTGYGVHVALLGHDLHGLVQGPDGRLYFSCGDRGFHVEMPGKGGGTLDHTRCGAVLRCELDGNGLEVFATGLRNPQELAFDPLGNLFTGDNNSDGGDRARWVYVIEGGDSGWRYGYQWITEPSLRGPWNDEEQWKPHFPGQAAFLVPPVANLANGPAGLARHPGTGLAPEYREHFFLCDFRGSPAQSGVHAFRVEPRGAGFALGPVQRFVWGTLATDVDFGPDGALYFSDWVDGWNKTGKGRLYRVAPAASAADEARATQALLAAGMRQRAASELAGLLAHADQRVRQAAHLELAARPDGVAVLLAAARSGTAQLARVHGIFGLWAALRRGHARPDELRALLEDQDPEVRAQAARVLGDVRDAGAAAALVRCLGDESARVASLAAIALGRLRFAEATRDLFELARRAAEEDPWLRHAAVMGLAGCAAPERLIAARERRGADVRIAALLALRRQGHAGVASFLEDEDERVRVEAARAIHDVPIEAALPALAAAIERQLVPIERQLVPIGRRLEPLDRPLDASAHPRADPRAALRTAWVRRVLAANRLLGGEEQARALAAFVQRPAADVAGRREALAMLGEWASPSGRDTVLGEWRPLAARDASPLPALALELRDACLAAPELTGAWIGLVRAHRVHAAAPDLAALVADAGRAEAVRTAALAALAEVDAAAALDALRQALRDPSDALRAAALELLPRFAPDELLPLLERCLASGERGERRVALRLLGASAADGAARLLAAELERLRAGLFPAELALDLVQAAEQHAALAGALGLLRASRAADPELGPYLDALFGGDAARGERLFLERADLACLRCHPSVAPDAEAGPSVGQDLRGVGGRLTRLELAAAIVAPNRRIAPGFESVLVVLEDESVHAGRVLDEDATSLRLLDADGAVVTLPRAEISARRESPSAMPEGLAQLLTRAELRDLLEYLSSL